MRICRISLHLGLGEDLRRRLRLVRGSSAAGPVERRLDDHRKFRQAGGHEHGAQRPEPVHEICPQGRSGHWQPAVGRARATLPTGPGQFAGAKYTEGIHSTEIQPFLGYLLIRNRFYLHGFLSLSVPSSIRDVTMVYNDLGIGYFVFRSTDPDSALTSVAPTFEVHVNSPLTHRDWFNANDPPGTADVVDLTYG